MDLTVLLEPEIDLPRLTEVLDGMGHEGRLHTAYGWGKSTQAKLFEAAKGHMRGSLDYLAPKTAEPLTETIHDESVHWGKNTLGAFSHFQKRFAKPTAAGAEYVVGYNHQPTALIGAATGPGYFTATASEDGELVIDYTKLPKERVPSWPEIISNKARLGFLVWDGMIDYLRPLSTHVSIGRAAKKGKMMDARFVLVREDD